MPHIINSEPGVNGQQFCSKSIKLIEDTGHRKTVTFRSSGGRAYIILRQSLCTSNNTGKHFQVRFARCIY